MPYCSLTSIIHNCIPCDHSSAKDSWTTRKMQPKCNSRYHRRPSRVFYIAAMATSRSGVAMTPGCYQPEVKCWFIVMGRDSVYLRKCAQGHHYRERWGADRNLHKFKFHSDCSYLRRIGTLWINAHYQQQHGIIRQLYTFRLRKCQLRCDHALHEYCLSTEEYELKNALK